MRVVRCVCGPVCARITVVVAEALRSGHAGVTAAQKKVGTAMTSSPRGGSAWDDRGYFFCHLNGLGSKRLNLLLLANLVLMTWICLT